MPGKVSITPWVIFKFLVFIVAVIIGCWVVVDTILSHTVRYDPIYEEGRTAAKNGGLAKDNPYKFQRWSDIRWLAGYIDGKDEPHEP